MAKLTINTHGGLSGEADFKLMVKPGTTFTVEKNGEAVSYICRKYEGNKSRQCYKCAICHNIDLCVHLECAIPTSDGNPIMYKFARI